MVRTYALVVVVLAFASCGGNATTGAPTGGAGSGGYVGVPFEDHADLQLAATCDFGVRCGYYPTREACEAAYLPLIRQRIYDVTKGFTKYDGAAFAQCMAAHANRECTLTAARAGRAEICRESFKGTQPAGANCNWNYECASDACVTTAVTCIQQCCPGTCAANDLALGQPCSFQGACGTAGFCQATSSGAATGVCAARLAAGQACTLDDECPIDLFCRADVPNGARTCRRLPARGEPCHPSQLRCDSLLDRCDPETNVCVPAEMPGGECAVEADCVGYATCDTAAMRCYARSTPGGPCTKTADCLGNSTCAGSICKLAEDPIPCTLLR
jgi:hypothetical protein